MKKYFLLNDGNKIPSLGLGTWRSDENLVGEAVKYALTRVSYKHIDCASIYGNEKKIGKIFKDVFAKTVKRKDIFITGKLWNTDHAIKDVEKACKRTLSDLKIDYLDLYLMHWGIAFKPGGDLEPLDKNGKVITLPVSIRETWEALEGLVKKGLVKSIGVANFSTIMLVDLLIYAKIKPVMNQIELHPYNTQKELVEYCKYKNIVVTAYSPLGSRGDNKLKKELFNESIIKSLVKKYKKTSAQILLNWGIERGTVVIPKSTNVQRIKENSEIFDFELTKEEQENISLLNKNYRFVDPVIWWGVPYFR